MTEYTTTGPDGGPFSRQVTTDAGDRVVGRFGFAVDRRIEGSAHACAVRGSVPHGTITAIDISEAKAVPGVLAVITGQDVQADPSVADTQGETRQDQPVLAFDKVRYVGEPVAVVVAETRAAAEDAAALVDVEIAELDFVVDHEPAGQPGAPVLHQQWPDNECGTWTLRHGDAEAAMARAEVVHRATYRSPAANHAPMEPHVATAAWLPDGSLVVWTGSQSPYAVRRRLAQIFGLADDRVRVCVDPLGGGFGAKLDLRLEALVALGSRTVGRPVRMELRRDEIFMTASKHAATVTITTGADRDGRLRARIVDIVYNGGAYALSTPRSTRTGMIRSPGPYAIPDVLCRVVGRYTNTVPAGPFRGAMTGQVCWAHESAMDELAALLDMDPVELRMRNVLRDGDVFATGEAMRDMRYRDLVEAAAKGVDWDAETGSTRPGTSRGKGLAVVLKSTRTPSRSEAHVVLDATGRITVRTSSIEMGQGAHTSMAELVAARLRMPAGEVFVSLVDTHRTPFDTTTSSSRSTLTMGTAVELAADDLRRRIDELATAGRPGTAPRPRERRRHRRAAGARRAAVRRSAHRRGSGRARRYRLLPVASRSGRDGSRDDAGDAHRQLASGGGRGRGGGRRGDRPRTRPPGARCELRGTCRRRSEDPQTDRGRDDLRARSGVDGGGRLRRRPGEQPQPLRLPDTVDPRRARRHGQHRADRPRPCCAPARCR